VSKALGAQHDASISIYNNGVFMAIYFGKVNKYIADRGFGFVSDVFVNSNSSDFFST
jgi:hypothetical protein